MTRPILRRLSAVMLLALMTISAGRVLCLLPCASMDAHPADAKTAKCEHLADATSRLTDLRPLCEGCDGLRVSVVNRVIDRHGTEDSAAPSIEVAALFERWSARIIRHDLPPLPPDRLPVHTYTPLRI